MNSSNSLLQNLADTRSRGDPGFSLIIAFDYYDGPERGLAVYPSGECVRFLSLGESRSRLFRAFELAPVSGDWWQRIRAMPEVGNMAQPARRVIVATENSETLSLLERDVSCAPASANYIGVGSPSLDWLMVSSLSEVQLEAIRQLGCTLASFQAAHQMLKEKSNQRSKLG